METDTVVGHSGASMNDESIKRLREAVHGWQVKSYSAEFSWFWKIRAAGAEHEPPLLDWLRENADDQRRRDRNLLIVWYGMPSFENRPIKIANHLTPFDWALSLSHHLLSRDSERPPLRIVILDCHSREMPNASGHYMVDSLLASLPWLWVVRLLPQGDDDRTIADRFGADDLKKLIGNCSQADNSVPTLANQDHHQARKIVGALVQAWVGNLARSETHHDVNNILGPLVLHQSFAQTPSEHHLGRQALLQHARWLGLAPDKIGAGSDVWFDAQNVARELNRTMRFVLVDDQINNGWGDVVAAALGLALEAGVRQATPNEITRLAEPVNNVELWGATSPHPLMKRLEEALEIDGTTHDRRFNLLFTGNEGGAPPLEVVLLDLRLATSREAEVAYFEAAIKLAETLTERHGDGSWPWRPLADKNGGIDQLKSVVKDYAAGKPGDTTYLQLLTLPVRILASVDLSLPIIVFSSTGQRSVVEEFKGYGNIITAFEKPRFLGYRAGDMLSEAKNNWAAAMKQASGLLRGRTEIQRIILGSRPRLPIFEDGKGQYLINLYLDETGDEYEEMEVGGVLVIGSTKNVKHFEQCLDQIGLKYFRNDKDPKYFLRNTVNKCADSIAECCNNIHCSFVSLKGKWRELDPTVGDVENELEADNLYRQMVATLTEVAVYHLAAALFKEEPGEDSIVDYKLYMANRGKAPSDDPNKSEDLWRRWGVRKEYVGDGRNLWEAIKNLEDFCKHTDNKILSRQHAELQTILENLRPCVGAYVAYDRKKYRQKELIRYVSDDAARPIVQGISQQYKEARFRPRPQHARAYPLNSLRQEIHDLHYMADALMSPNAECHDSVQNLRTKGFSGIYNPDLLILLEAARRVVNGFIGDGLAIAARCSGSLQSEPKTDVRRLLLARLGKSAMEMHGTELIRMISNIEDRAARAPWKNCKRQNGERGHDWTVSGFAEDVTMENVGTIVQEYLVSRGLWSEGARAEGKWNKKVTCRLYHLPNGGLEETRTEASETNTPRMT